jgi:hypothetical protein
MAPALLMLVSALYAHPLHLMRHLKLVCTFDPSIAMRKFPAARPGLYSCALSGPGNISELPERFVKLKQIAHAANSGIVVWRDEDLPGGICKYESSENGTIMEFGNQVLDECYGYGYGTPPNDVQKQYLVASSPAEILSTVPVPF